MLETVVGQRFGNPALVQKKLDNGTSGLFSGHLSKNRLQIIAESRLAGPWAEVVETVGGYWHQRDKEFADFPLLAEVVETVGGYWHTTHVSVNLITVAAEVVETVGGYWHRHVNRSSE